MQICVSRHANKQRLFASTAWALFLGDCGGGHAPASPGAGDAGAGGWGWGWGVGCPGKGSRRGSSAGGEGGAAPSSSARAWQAGAGSGGGPKLSRLRAGGRRLVLSDVPLLQDDLSLPGRQLALVVAERPQLLRLLFLPLHLLLLLSRLLFPGRGVGGTIPGKGERVGQAPWGGVTGGKEWVTEGRDGVAGDRGTNEWWAGQWVVGVEGDWGQGVG